VHKELRFHHVLKRSLSECK